MGLFIALVICVTLYHTIKRFLEHNVRCRAIEAAKTLSFHGRSLPSAEESKDDVPPELVEAYKELQEEFPDRK